MKGLLLKDFYQLVKYCRTFLLIDVVFLAVSFFIEDGLMFVYFPIIFAGILPLTLLSYDERSGWVKYCGTLPYSEKQIVSAKYLLGLILQAISAVVVIGVMYARCFMYKDDSFVEGLFVLGIVFPASLSFPTICLPLCFKFGSEKGRIAYFIIIALIFTAFNLLYEKLADRIQVLGTDLSMIISIIAGAITVLYIVSWVVSVPILKSAKK